MPIVWPVLAVVDHRPGPGAVHDTMCTCLRQVSALSDIADGLISVVCSTS